jgi:hypothetical protein
VKDFTKEFNDAIGQAIKIVGDDGDVPVPNVMPTDLLGDAKGVLVALNAMRDSMLDLIQEYEKQVDAIKNSLKQFQNAIAKSDFGLDPKKPEDKKKITQAQAVLTKMITGVSADCDTELKSVDELEKRASQKF